MKETLKKKVTKILELYPRARNDDIALQCFLIRDYFPQGIKQDEEGKWWISTEACRLYRDDHISRVRAIVQNQEGKFLPTDPKVIKQRRLNEANWYEHVTMR